MASLELSEQEAEKLLQNADVIRDPLHGDISLTALERRIVDSADFQRLRNINQLAMTYVAYPGAIHTRFIHSIGTLHVCSTLIETCNKNAREFAVGMEADHPVPVRITGYPIVLARLCALTHDLAHVPFGHTFEKEAGIFLRDEWKDDWRVKKLLGPDSQVAKILNEVFGLNRISLSKATVLLNDIKDILTSDRKDVPNLKYPFVHDLVGNTVCADLIDYVQRDMYFCGLVERFGDRFLKYIAVFPIEERKARDEKAVAILKPMRMETETVFETRTNHNKRSVCRVVLLGYRYNERVEVVNKPDVFGEAIDLVRKRLTVARKLYFHRTKLVASAMLSEAAFAHGFKKAEDIWDKSDQEVLKLFLASTNESTRVLAGRILNRRLFKSIYRCSHHEDDESPASKVIRKARGKYSDPKTRHQLVERLERLVGFMVRDGIAAKGCVVVSCPDKDMGLKGFDMLVLPTPDEDIHTLQESKHKSIKAEIASIQDTHRFLWRLEVFVDPEVIRLGHGSPVTAQLSAAIQYEIGPPNEIAGFDNSHGKNLDELEQEYIVGHFVQKTGIADKIKHDDLRSLRTIALRSENLSLEDFEKMITDQIRSMGYNIKQ
jgi:uncharacterized protein